MSVSGRDGDAFAQRRVLAPLADDHCGDTVADKLVSALASDMKRSMPRIAPNLRQNVTHSREGGGQHDKAAAGDPCRSRMLAATRQQGKLMAEVGGGFVAWAMNTAAMVKVNCRAV